MVEAIRRCHERLRTGLITNNMAPMADGDGRALSFVHDLFDVIIESSIVGVRKPDQRIYEIACEQLGVAADEIVFLDRYDLGVAVQTDDGLVVPVVRDCARRSVEDLAADVAGDRDPLLDPGLPRGGHVRQGPRGGQPAGRRRG